MSKKFKSPLRGLVSRMEPGETICIGNSEPLTKKEALKAIREAEAQFEDFIAAINKKHSKDGTK